MDGGRGQQGGRKSKGRKRKGGGESVLRYSYSPSIAALHAYTYMLQVLESRKQELCPLFAFSARLKTYVLLLHCVLLLLPSCSYIRILADHEMREIN
jgi:BarA-like signal transduction histidine kinase